MKKPSFKKNHVPGRGTVSPVIDHREGGRRSIKEAVF